MSVRLHSREKVLLCVLAATGLWLWFPRSESRAVPMASLSAVQSPDELPAKPIRIPVIRKLDEPSPPPRAPRRNPFKFADEPEQFVVAAPPPPPPPPEIKPESRFLGTLDEGRPRALFGLKGDVIPLAAGDALEGKYIVRQVAPDSVVLESITHHNSTTLWMPRQ